MEPTSVGTTSQAAQASRTRGKIDSLQVLRALAFLGIFLEHADGWIRWPSLGVSVFLVLSGFLMQRNYSDAELIPSIKNNLKFAIAKIKKLYHLHILTGVLALILNVITIVQSGAQLQSLLLLPVKMVLSALLLQSWVPDIRINWCLNGVAWYLSVMLFMYFVFPFLKDRIKKARPRNLGILCVAILLVEIAVCIPVVAVFGPESPVYQWFMYCFPVFRLGEFVIGCALARWYMEKPHDAVGAAKVAAFAIVALVLTVLVELWARQGYSGALQAALHNWTTVYIPLAAAWLCLFALDRGFVKGLSACKPILFVGDISAYNFLIHIMVIKYCNLILTLFGIGCDPDFLNPDIDGIAKLGLIVLEFALALAASYGYKKLHDSWAAKQAQAKS